MMQHIIYTNTTYSSLTLTMFYRNKITFGVYNIWLGSTSRMFPVNFAWFLMWKRRNDKGMTAKSRLDVKSLVFYVLLLLLVCFHFWAEKNEFMEVPFHNLLNAAILLCLQDTDAFNLDKVFRLPWLKTKPPLGNSSIQYQLKIHSTMHTSISW